MDKGGVMGSGADWMYTGNDQIHRASTMVEHPPHYTFGKYEVIDVLEDWFPSEPLLWQVGKYISRWDKKGDPVENLEKAAFYLRRKIATLKEKRNAKIEQNQA